MYWGDDVRRELQSVHRLRERTGRTPSEEEVGGVNEMKRSPAELASTDFIGTNL